MDAFTYFFTNLALWNILLASAAFLFGLLMGHWMWGQFKKRLLETGSELSQTQAELAQQKEELAAFQNESEDVAGEWFSERKSLQTDLTTRGEELEKVRDALETALHEKQNLAERLEASQETLAEMEGIKKAQSLEIAEITEAKEAAEKQNKRLADEGEAWSEEKAKLEANLTREKSTSASLREVVAGLNEVQSGLRTRIEKLESELAENAQPKESSEKKTEKTPSPTSSAPKSKSKTGVKDD